MDLSQIPEALKFATTLGAGGLLAFAMFLFYRKDTLSAAEAWRGQSANLLEVVKENTAAMTSLQATTSALHASVDALRVEMNEREVARLRERAR